MTLRQTAFHSRTAVLGARFAEYAGYDFPSQYADDLLDEYWACRLRAVVMDLTPLRKLEVSGRDSGALLQATVTRDLTRLRNGSVVYTALCDSEGNVVDDGTVFRLGPERFRWIGYTDEDEAWFRSHAERLGLQVALENSTDSLHNLAVQGPESRAIMSKIVVSADGRPALDELSWFTFTEGTLGEGGPEVLVSRTGYSGELGYEVWCHPSDGGAVWDAVMSAGEEFGIGPLGLDALDVLRVEAGLIFKGYEYEGAEDPFEAGIGFTVTKAKQDDFVGKQALQRRRESPVQVLVGLESGGDDPFAHGDAVIAGNEPVGIVTSGVSSPLLRKNLALARVAVAASTIGATLEVSRAGTSGSESAVVTRFPFYDPDKSRPKS